MFTPHTNREEILGREFTIVKNGLDKDEVLSFVESLINRNNDLTDMLENIQPFSAGIEKLSNDDSVQTGGGEPKKKKEALKRGSLAFSNSEVKAGMKAKDEIADIIVSEALQRAQEMVAEKLSLAEQQAKDILETAEDEAREVRRQAKEEVDKTIAEARLKSEAAELAAQKILDEAAGNVDSIRTLAEDEATRLIDGVKERAEQLAREKISKAEEEGKHIIEEAVKTAEEEAQRVKQEAEFMLLISKKLGEDEIKENFDKFCTGLLLSSTEVKTGRQSSIVNGPQEQRESQVLYEGSVELSIKPPVALDRIVKLHRHLRGTPQIKVVNMIGTKDKGLRMQLLLKDRTPLIDVLKALPEVKTISAQQQPYDTSKLSGLPVKGKQPLRRIVLSTRE